VQLQLGQNAIGEDAKDALRAIAIARSLRLSC